MSAVLKYECPCCGGSIEFDSQSQQMKCPYCETTFDVEAMKQLEEAQKDSTGSEMNWDTQAGSEWEQGETEGMRIYTCKSCGGEIVAEETTGASACPYCGSPVVMSGSFEGDLKPDLVIPFKLDKEAAKAALTKHLSGKKFLPKLFKDQNHIDEIKGVYVPFWLFDAEADANILYRAEKKRRWNDDNFNYTETSYYMVKRAGSLAFDSVPVDGSSQMPDELMESIEPFDYKDATDFRTAYLSGYLADRYDVTAEDSINRANERITESTKRTFRDTVMGFDTVDETNASIRLKNGKARYILCPVWILNTTWNGEKYTFAMNGQTGKFVGNLPMDKGAFWRSFAIYAGIASVVAYIIMTLLG